MMCYCTDGTFSNLIFGIRQLVFDAIIISIYVTGITNILSFIYFGTAFIKIALSWCKKSNFTLAYSDARTKNEELNQFSFFKILKFISK